MILSFCIIVLLNGLYRPVLTRSFFCLAARFNVGQFCVLAWVAPSAVPWSCATKHHGDIARAARPLPRQLRGNHRLNTDEMEPTRAGLVTRCLIGLQESGALTSVKWRLRVMNWWWKSFLNRIQADCNLSSKFRYIFSLLLLSFIFR